MRAIFCVDPGESTGVAWAILDETARTAIEAVRNRIERDSRTLVGPERDQIRQLYHMWTTFKRKAVNVGLLDPEKVDLVVEDFVLYPGERPGRATTTPERIAWGFEGYRMAMSDSWRKSLPKHYNEIIWQKSGAAHTFSRRTILEAADAWIVGKQHERSALAHMILRTNVLMDNRSSRLITRASARPRD